jgi:putative ABC transport system permease protein
MNTSLSLAIAHLRHHKSQAIIITLILFFLIFLPLFVLTTVGVLQTQLRERAKTTPLLMTPAQGKVEAILQHLHFQWEGNPPTFTPSECFALFDERPMETLPLVLIYECLSPDGKSTSPLLGTTSNYLSFRKLSLSQGREAQHAGEVVLGHQLAQRWALKTGDFLRTAPHHLLDLSQAHQLELLVVGVLKSSGKPEDELAITLPETTWIKMGLGHGHPEENLEGVPKALHMSVYSEQEGYRRILQDNRKHIHFHQPKNLLPLTGMIVLPNNEESRLFSLAWGQNHPSLEIVDPIKITDRILASLHRLGDLLLLILAVVSGASLILMGLLLRMSFIMRKEDQKVLDELGTPASTFTMTIFTEWCIYLGLALALAFIVLGISQGGSPNIAKLLTLIKN